MYQSRSEDLNPKISEFAAEALTIERALTYIDKKLKKLYSIQENSFKIQFKYTDHEHAFEPIEYNQIEKEFRDEMWETKKKLESGVMFAFITLLEAEREDLIKKWNSLTKKLA